ncbi:hypothetical protein [Candidatus Finniella inopinata]|uniref:Macro domain-containing protein n=1 Tax=Candidatus Finniella inopinata TaxID=1696036 RepID=A0A4Q7DH00_9PROT|nr:hypothetical protein [Candidatus Finniella inopinata]RZI45518.1 hypothetical protein EQU50_06805 [Candidatus Finniella inopinata]
MKSLFKISVSLVVLYATCITSFASATSNRTKVNIIPLGSYASSRIVTTSNADSSMADLSVNLKAILFDEIQPAVQILHEELRPLSVKYKIVETKNDAGWSDYIREAHQLAKASEAEWQPLVDRNPLIPVSLEEIDAAYKRVTRSLSTTEKHKSNPRFFLVLGVDALKLTQSPAAENAVIQAASQGNFLESSSSDYMPYTDYIYDQTQGPRVSLASLAALIVRDYCMRSTPTDKTPKQPLLEDNLASFKLESGAVLENGYLKPALLNDHDQETFATRLETAGPGDLRILAQPGYSEDGKNILQVLNFAPAYQGFHPPASGSAGHRICKFLVPPQYRATAQLAVMKAVKTGRRIPLHLTLIGQGAFKNPSDVMKKALKDVYDTVQGYDVDVYIHVFSKSGLDKLQPNLPSEIGTLTVSSNKDFDMFAPGKPFDPYIFYTMSSSF